MPDDLPDLAGPYLSHNMQARAIVAENEVENLRSKNRDFLSQYFAVCEENAALRSEITTIKAQLQAALEVLG